MNAPARFVPDPLARLIAGRAERSVSFEKGVTPAWVPDSFEDAYAVQDKVIQYRGERAAGWKVGAPSATGDIRCAPLPSAGLLPGGAVVEQSAFADAGLELEIAFRFRRALTQADLPGDDEEILSLLDGMAPAIELVSSRFAEWPNVPPLAQLADLQSHGALIVGEFVPYRPGYPFTAPSGSLAFDGETVVDKDLRNPAGDPRRLLPWLVRHCAARGLPVTPDTVITTGSYTGVHFPRRRGTATGRLSGLPPISVTLGELP